MKIEIEEYKGQTILYDEDEDKFVCDMEIEGTVIGAKRQSLKEVRKSIDLFVKKNLNFKPFKAIKVSYGSEMSIVNIIAIRTDGKLVSGTEMYNSHIDKKGADELKVYDIDVVNKYEASIANLERIRKEHKDLTRRLIDGLTQMDLSKYDLK